MSANEEQIKKIGEWARGADMSLQEIEAFEAIGVMARQLLNRKEVECEPVKPTQSQDLS